MRVARLVILFVIFVAIPTALLAQQAAQPIQRDPQAVAVLQRAVVAMGATAPNDSVATGNMVIEAGGKTDSGTIRILTRGWNQSREDTAMNNKTHSVVFAGEAGSEGDNGALSALPLELVLSSQTPCFPVVTLTASLGDSDAAFQYVGLEELPSGSAHHIRFWSTFSSRPDWQPLAELTVKDIWVDANSLLPVELAYERRAASGEEPRIAHAAFFSDYRNVGGILYPFHIERHVNGTPWATIQIQSVQLNTGLTNTNFTVQR